MKADWDKHYSSNNTKLINLEGKGVWNLLENGGTLLRTINREVLLLSIGKRKYKFTPLFIFYSFDK